MKMRGGLSALLLTVPAVFLLAGCFGGPTELLLVTPRLEIDRVIAEEFARQLGEQTSVSVALVPSDADRSALDVLASGGADLALVSNNESFRSGVATVLPLYPTVLHIAYRSDLELIEPSEVFDSSSVFAGPPGSVSRKLLEETAGTLGIEPEEINFVGNDECVDVAVVYAPILPDIPSGLSECGSYRLMSLAEPSELGQGSRVDAAALLNPKLKPFIIPSDTYGALSPSPVVTLAVDKLLVARREIPDAVIYDLISEVLRLQPALSAHYPGLFHGLNEEFNASNSAFMLHPGTEAYLDRDAPDVYERYSGVAEVLVTLFIGLISGIYAVFRILSIRRKNRIDGFYSQAMVIQAGAQDSTEPDVRRQAVLDLRPFRPVRSRC